MVMSGAGLGWRAETLSDLCFCRAPGKKVEDSQDTEEEGQVSACSKADHPRGRMSIALPALRHVPLFPPPSTLTPTHISSIKDDSLRLILLPYITASPVSYRKPSPTQLP